MTRAASIAEAFAYFDSKSFHADLARRVAIATESQNPDRAADLAAYLLVCQRCYRMAMAT